MPSRTSDRRLSVVLSADVVGYSRLMAEDETGTVTAINACRGIVEQVVERYQGRVVDFVGDNFLAEFTAATEAVECAVEIQRSASALPAAGLRFRMGLHLAEIRADGGRIFGTGVNVAARLEGLARPGGICVSRAVREQFSAAASGLVFQDLGERRLKNLPEPIRAFGVHWTDDSEDPPANRSRVDAEAPSVAVLPFENMSPDPDQVYFADGIAEELITALTRVDGLRIIARSSAFSFRGTQADVSTIGRALGVTAVVEGSVRRSGEQVRISARLIDVQGGHHLWSDVYDRPLVDVFEVQDEIARTVVGKIKPRLIQEPSQRLVKAGTQSRAAYDLYLRAAERLARHDRWDTRTAIAMLEDATRIDPGYADAWARLGMSCCQMEFGFEPDARWGEQAEVSLSKAFELDPENAEAHVARGRLLWTPRQAFRHAEALEAFGEALRRQPGSHDALIWRSVILFHVGFLEEGLAGLREAQEVRPDDALTLNLLSQAALFLGRVEESREYVDRTLRVDATHLYAHLFAPYVCVRAGDLGGAEEALVRAREVVGDDAMLDANEAVLWAERGEAGRAREWIRRAEAAGRSVAHLHHAWHVSAVASCTIEDRERSIELLRRAATSGLPNAPLFSGDSRLDSLSSEPQMVEFLHELESQREALAVAAGLAVGTGSRSLR